MRKSDQKKEKKFQTVKIGYHKTAKISQINSINMRKDNKTNKLIFEGNSHRQI